MKTFLLLTLLTSKSLYAMSAGVIVEGAYVRLMPKSAQTSAAFMKITNHSEKKVALTRAKSNVAKSVEVHSHIMEKGVMKMVEVPGIDLPPHKTVELRAGSYHIMLIDLVKPLVQGEKIKFELTFSDGSKQMMDLPVAENSPMEDHRHH